MALNNCKLVLDEHKDVVVGSTGLSSMELEIVPNPGYFVDVAWFQDNTSVTFPETIGVIDSITLTNTSAIPHANDNRVKVEVVFSPSYSINEDTDINIDIDGDAFRIPNVNITLGISENISNNPKGIFSIQPSPGFTTLVNSPISSPNILGDSESDLANTSKLHFIQGGMLMGVESKVAEVTFTALQPDTNYLWHFSDWPGFNEGDGPENNLGDTGGSTPYLFPMLEGNMPSNFRVEHSPPTGSTTQAGLKYTEFTFNIYYTPVPDDYNFADNALSPSDYNTSNSLYPIWYFGIYNPDSILPPDLGDWTGITRESFPYLLDKYIINSRTYLERSQITRPLTINNISTIDLANLGGGAFNIIPPRGIYQGNRPTVKIFGDFGAEFTIKFRESKVVESITGRSTITGAADYFDGEIPDMPTGVVTIPKSGVYSFKMPAVAPFLGTGYKEFEMVVTASDSTIIASSAVKEGGTSHNIDTVGSIVTNIFYQRPSVNIGFAVTKPVDWVYQGVYTDVIQLPPVGGGGASGSERKSGVALALVDKDPTKPSSNYAFNFEIRVKKTGGIFRSFAEHHWVEAGLADALWLGYTGYYIPTSNPGTYDVTLAEYGFKSEAFVPSVLDNGDIVTFSNLRHAVGEGLSDHTGDFNEFATISGRIDVKQFGAGDQTYTIDLETLFIWT